MTRRPLLLATALAVATLLASLATPTGAASAARPPRTVVAGLSGLDAIACPTDTSCVAVGSDTDGDGKGAAIDAADGAVSAGAGHLDDDVLFGVACATSTKCVAVSDETSASVNPATGAVKVAGTVKPPKNGIVAVDDIACPTKQSCYGVGFIGTELKSKAIVVHYSASGAVEGKAESSSTGYGTIFCPSSKLCFVAAANGANKSEWIRQLHGDKVGAKHTVPKGVYVQSAACYKTKVCYLLAGRTSGFRTDLLYPVNPKTGAIGKVITVGGDFTGDGIACASAKVCIAVGLTGTGQSAQPASVEITKAKAAAPVHYSGGAFSAVACTPAGDCFGVGSGPSGAYADRV